MKQYSIEIEIPKLNSTQSKVYHYLYADSGFELGFGKAGTYSGHSHLFFCDVLFSAKPISTSDADGKTISGNLIVIPPRTYLGEVVTDDFFFIKFCPTNEKIMLPDKREDILTDGKIEAFNGNAAMEIPWYEKNTSRESSVTFSLQNEKLHIKIGETEFIIDK
jgi:hypothetical protein